MAIRQGSGVLTAVGLGSCIGVVVWNRAKQVGGILHVLLPDSRRDGERAKKRPLHYADSGIAQMAKAFKELDVDLRRSTVGLFGGAHMTPGPDGFQMGKRNLLACRKVLWRHRMVVRVESCGGNTSRSIDLDIASGRLRISMPGNPEKVHQL